jgi:hypothetical protein
MILSPLFNITNTNTGINPETPEKETFITRRSSKLSTPFSRDKWITGENQTGSPAILTPSGSVEKNKKRTPGRALKLIGDLYLLSGRIDLALKLYIICNCSLYNAIEAAKGHSDFYWQASATESFLSAYLISIINTDPVKISIIVESWKIS